MSNLDNWLEENQWQLCSTTDVKDLRDAVAADIAEALKPSHNSDYAAALRVRNEYVDTHSIKGADINGFADYCEQRLNSAEPNCA